ncbi:hypothetical protein [Planotetraspora sp. GP83]|uniref:hypothetical protein n=1 Tax=Planotetraspora sp. GP83 TaxID=3156264 RepID=UPI0035136EEE
MTDPTTTALVPDEVWARLEAACDLDCYSVTGQWDVENLLLDAQNHIGDALPQLLGMGTVDTSDADQEDLIVLVDMPGGPCLATTVIQLREFRTEDAVDGPERARAVLERLLACHAELMADLNAARTAGPLTSMFTADEVECLIRTAAEAVHGNALGDDTLSERQITLSARAYDLMQQEFDGDRPVGAAH